MNATLIKNKLFEKFSPFAISQSVYLHTKRTANIEELTDEELQALYIMFFPQEPTLAKQLTEAKHKDALKQQKSIILSIATRIGIHDTNDWTKFNNWMLKSSVHKKKLNDYSLSELEDLKKQLFATERNYNRSAEKVGNKAWHHKNKFPTPSKN